MKSRVYLVQEPLFRDEKGIVRPRINYRTLRPYGTLHMLLPWSEASEKTDFHDDAASIVNTLRSQLAAFTDHDWIVPLGNPALIGMAITIAADANEGRVQILDWIKAERRYRELRVDFDADLRDSGQNLAPAAPAR